MRGAFERSRAGQVAAAFLTIASLLSPTVAYGTQLGDQVPPSCSSQGASVSPSTVASGGHVVLRATGFAPGTSVMLELSGPTPVEPATGQADISCVVSTTLEILPTDRPGRYTIRVTGLGYGEEPLQLSASFAVEAAGPPAQPGPATTVPTAQRSPTPTPRPAPPGGVFQPGVGVPAETTPVAPSPTTPPVAPPDGRIRVAKPQPAAPAEGAIVAVPGATQGQKVWLRATIMDLALIWNGDRGQGPLFVDRGLGEVFITSWIYWPSNTEDKNPQTANIFLPDFATGERRQIGETVYFGRADCPVASYVIVEWLVWEDDQSQSLDDVKELVSKLAQAAANAGLTAGVGALGKYVPLAGDAQAITEIGGRLVRDLIDELTQNDNDLLGRYSDIIEFPNPCDSDRPIRKDGLEGNERAFLQNVVPAAQWREAKTDDGRSLPDPQPRFNGSIGWRVTGGKEVNKTSALATKTDPPAYTDVAMVDIGQTDEATLTAGLTLGAPLPLGPLAVSYSVLLDVDNNLATGARGFPTDGADYEMRLELGRSGQPLGRLLRYNSPTATFEDLAGGLYDWTLGTDRTEIYLSAQLARLGNPVGPVAGWAFARTDEGLASVVPERPREAAPIILLDYGPTGNPPFVVARSPGPNAAEVDQTTDICVSFSKAMDRDGVATGFSMQPAATGIFSWRGHTLCFRPDAPLEPWTDYTVVLGESTADTLGAPLEADEDLAPGGVEAWRFRTAGAALSASDAFGVRQRAFSVGQPLYATGEAFPSDATFNLYVVARPEPLADGMVLSDVRDGGPTEVSTDGKGFFGPTLLWGQASGDGELNIVVDVDGNGRFDAGIDRIDSSGVGFVVLRR